MTISTERKQAYHDIFITALEGSIGYWSIASKYHWRKKDGTEDINGFYAIISDCEEQDFEDLKIDYSTIRKGVNKIINGDVQISDYIRQQIVQAFKNFDMGMIDANGADCIVQVGLFGEIVYG